MPFDLEYRQVHAGKDLRQFTALITGHGWFFTDTVYHLEGNRGVYMRVCVCVCVYVFACETLIDSTQKKKILSGKTVHTPRWGKLQLPVSCTLSVKNLKWTVRMFGMMSMRSSAWSAGQHFKHGAHWPNRWPSETFGETQTSLGTILFGVFNCDGSFWNRADGAWSDSTRKVWEHWRSEDWSHWIVWLVDAPTHWRWLRWFWSYQYPQ